VFISGGNPHLTSRFCKYELGPKFQHGIRASSKICWAICYLVSAIGPPTIYVHKPSPIVLVVRGCVKSLTSDRRWSNNVFISGGNPHLTSQFCKYELGSKFQQLLIIYVLYNFSGMNLNLSKA